MIDGVDPQELIPTTDEQLQASSMETVVSGYNNLKANKLSLCDIQRKIEPPIDLDHTSLSNFHPFDPLSDFGTLSKMSQQQQSLPTMSSRDEGECLVTDSAATIEIPRYNATASSQWLCQMGANAVSADIKKDLDEDGVECERAQSAYTTSDCNLHPTTATYALNFAQQIQPASAIAAYSSAGDTCAYVQPGIAENSAPVRMLVPVSAVANSEDISEPLDTLANMPICTGRETHNQKERKRRYRIKNACSLLKDLIPGLSDKTDKATVLEYTVQYLIHLKRHIGRQFDRTFLQKYSPY